MRDKFHKFIQAALSFLLKRKEICGIWEHSYFPCKTCKKNHFLCKNVHTGTFRAQTMKNVQKAEKRAKVDTLLFPVRQKEV
jgi:hypothetical protein